MFSVQIFCAIIGSIIGSTWTAANYEAAVYLGIDSEDEWASTWGLLFI